MLGPPRVTTVRGCTMAWTEFGEGPPLVLLHGLVDCHRTWRRVAPRLAERFRVYLPDLPGHGLSGRPDAPYTIEWYADTVAAWLEEVGLDRVHVIGHSFGGGVAQALLLRHRARIERLVLVASGGLGPEVGVPLRLAAFPVFGPLLAPAVIRIATPIVLRLAGGDYARPEPEEIARLAWLNAAPGSALAFRRTVAGCIDVFGQIEQAWDRLHLVDDLPPIALVWGERDRVVPVRHGYDALERIEGAVFAPYESIGHFPHLEASERFAEDVTAFLDGDRILPRARLRWLPVIQGREGRVRRWILPVGRAIRRALRPAA